MSLALAVSAIFLASQPARATGPLSVDVTANPSTVKAPGGLVTFNVVITNNHDEPLTITSLTDSIYGDINGQGTCAVGAVLAPGGTYACSYTATVTGVAGAFQANTLTVKATDPAAAQFSASDASVVVITPRLGVSMTPNPSSMAPPGGTVTFAISAVNLGPDSITISAITDSVYGNLSTRGTCTSAVGTVLASEGANYSCSFTATVSQTQTNTVTITATGTGGPFTASDPATVTIAATTTSSTSTTKLAAAAATTTSTAPGSTVGLTVALTQSAGVPDERFTVTGAGWDANELLTITFNSHPKVLATLVADSGGRFTANVRVPDDATVGAHTVVVSGRAGRSVSRPFTVSAGTTATTAAGGAATTPTTTRSGALARTGMSSGHFAVFATMVLMVGAAAVLASPKRRLAWSTPKVAKG